MDTSPDTGDLKQFRLVVDVDPEASDWPRLSILVDSQNPFHDAAPGWEGFDPDEMLAGVSVLLPQYPWRRVAVARCSCGFEGCGVIAPLIVERAGVVTWTDSRDYTGVFVGPFPHAGPDPHGGNAWDVTEIRFAAGQYRDEVARAVADRSWENARRATARLLRPRIEQILADIRPLDIVGFTLVPAWRAEGLNLTMTRKDAGGADTSWEYLRLEAPCTDPVNEAAAWADRLRSIPVGRWHSHFGSDPQPRR